MSPLGFSQTGYVQGHLSRRSIVLQVLRYYVTFDPSRLSIMSPCYSLEFSDQKPAKPVISEGKITDTSDPEMRSNWRLCLFICFEKLNCIINRKLSDKTNTQQMRVDYEAGVMGNDSLRLRLADFMQIESLRRTYKVQGTFQTKRWY